MEDLPSSQLFVAHHPPGIYHFSFEFFGTACENRLVPMTRTQEAVKIAHGSGGTPIRTGVPTLHGIGMPRLTLLALVVPVLSFSSVVCPGEQPLQAPPPTEQASYTRAGIDVTLDQVDAFLLNISTVPLYVDVGGLEVTNYEGGQSAGYFSDLGVPGEATAVVVTPISKTDTTYVYYANNFVFENQIEGTVISDWTTGQDVLDDWRDGNLLGAYFQVEWKFETTDDNGLTLTRTPLEFEQRANPGTLYCNVIFLSILASTIETEMEAFETQIEAIYA